MLKTFPESHQTSQCEPHIFHIVGKRRTLSLAAIIRPTGWRRQIQIQRSIEESVQEESAHLGDSQNVFCLEFWH